MKNRKTYIPITLAELTNVTQSFSTSLEQIEYLAVTILGLQKKHKQNNTNENDDNELILEMIKFAENEIKNLGGRPVKWIEYPLITNVHDYNELKGSLSDDGKLQEWVKFLYNNIERSDEEHDGIVGWRFNDRVLRQAELDSTEIDGDDEGFSQLLWEALDVEDEFVDHLERQLITNTDPVIPKPKRNFPRSSPISIFIYEQIFNGQVEWQKAWKKLNDMADTKNTKTENLTLNNFGEKDVYLRRKMKQTSNKIDHAIEYQEDGVPTFKSVSRQDFGRMFRDELKKSRSRSETPQ